MSLPFHDSTAHLASRPRKGDQNAPWDEQCKVDVRGRSCATPSMRISMTRLQAHVQIKMRLYKPQNMTATYPNPTHNLNLSGDNSARASKPRAT